MQTMRNWGLLALLMIGAAWPAAAQYGFGGGAMVPPEFRGVLNPVVGSGAVYRFTADSGKTLRNEVEITVIGKENVAGKDAYWVEIGTKPPSGDQIYIKMLNAIDEGKKIVTSRIIFQMPGQPAMEMPSQMLNMATRGTVQTADVRDEAQLVGTEDVTTAAGTFNCQHYHYTGKDGKSGDVWLSSKVTPWGLVKGSSNDGDDIALVRTISGASDHITGAPVPFNPAVFAGARGR